MDEVAILDEKRNQILQQMRELRAMRKGSVIPQGGKEGKKEAGSQGAILAL